jgi:hypothetical protein
VAVLHALLVIAALVGVAVIPCAVCLSIVFLDETVERCGRAIRRGYRRGAGRLGTRLFAGRLGRRWRLVRIARALRVEPQLERSEPSAPPIQQVAADLRRLSRQRLGIATRSRVWFTAVQRAYDDRLGVACRQLGIEEHLAEVTGIDLDLERVRVEGLLEAAGLVLRDDSAGSRNGPR